MWFLFAFAAAIAQSGSQAFQNYVAQEHKLSKFFVLFCSSGVGALILFAVSWYHGFPEVHSYFWLVAAGTAGINFLAGPMLLKGYELADFSSVFSKILLTPIFMLGTSFVLLGEVPSIQGAIGVMFTVLGLVYMVYGGRSKNIQQISTAGWISRGEFLGIGVAFLWSISANFDKLAAIYSDAFFSAAGTLLLLALFHLSYLLFHVACGKRIFPHFSRYSFPKLTWIVIGLGSGLASVLIFQNLAFLRGLASYTIAIKRLGVIFAVLWGWLFFKEKNITQKLIGASIAVAGVVLIIAASGW